MRPFAVTPIWHVRKGFVMAVRSIRSAVARFVVITGLAASLLAGSYALVGPTDASAAINVQCLTVASFYYSLGDYYYSIKNWSMGDHYYSLADRTLNNC
jgi:hypothetical protein